MREDNFIAFYLAGIPYTAKDLGDDLLDMDIRQVFQAMVDRGMIPGIEPGQPWYKHLRIDRMESLDKDLQEGVLTDALVRDRQIAEEAFLADNSEENRQRMIEANRRVTMANKLIAD